MNLEEIRTEVNKLAGVLEEKNTGLQILQKKKSTVDAELPPKQEAVSLAKKCLERSLEQKKYIEQIISSGLTEVFGLPYIFVLETVYGADNAIKGLKPRLQEDGGELDDPLNSFGAAAQSIASVCFRIAILLLSSGTAKILIMDEPLANVSPSLQDRFRVFIEKICNETGLQMILITHTPEPFGRVWEVIKEKKKKKRISKIVEITEE